MLIGHSIGSADGVILTLDQAVSEMLQRTTANLIGQSYLDITHIADRPANVSKIASLKVHSGPIRIRKRYVLPEGSTVWVDTTVSQLSSGPDAGRLVGTLEWANEGRHLETPAILWKKARSMDAALRLRIAALGRDLFVDYPWLILLQLYLAEAEGRIISTQGIADIGETARGTIDRWLLVLARKGLVDRDYANGYVAQLTRSGLDHVEDLIVVGGV